MPLSLPSLFGALMVASIVAGCEDSRKATPAESSSSEAPTAASASAPEVDPQAPPELEEARQLVATFGDRLKRELMAGLEKGGPEAIAVCHTRAPALAKEAASGGWQVGRTSLKLRNPDNAPDEWEKSVLEELAAEAAAKKDAGTENSAATSERWKIVDHDGRRTFRYMKAITTAPLCVTCHGEPSGEIAEALDRLYPSDQARGYHPGELRGAFTLEKRL